MALIDVTPVMTGETTPPPYVVGYSSSWDNSIAYSGFNCFSSQVGSYWCSADGDRTNCWVSLDFGSPKKISAIKMKVGHTLSMNPKTITLEGLGNDSKWELIEKIENISFDNVYTFIPRIYTRVRIVVNETIGNTNYAYLGKITFYYDNIFDNIKYDTCSSRNASLAYSIPMNTTQAILAKTNDHREGLMGMANDVENYGDLYVVGRDGKSHLTKAGMKSEVIFDGNANTVGLFSLLKDVNNFKSILIVFDGYNDGVCKDTLEIPICEIIYEDSNVERFRKTFLMDRYLDINFKDGRTLKIIKIEKLTSPSMGIRKIIGIY